MLGAVHVEVVYDQLGMWAGIGVGLNERNAIKWSWTSYVLSGGRTLEGIVFCHLKPPGRVPIKCEHTPLAAVRKIPSLDQNEPQVNLRCVSSNIAGRFVKVGAQQPSIEVRS